MRFAAAVAAASVAGLASASVQYDAPKNGTAPAYVTEVVTAYTTYCPEATEITHAGETYTVSEATTLTITNCPGGCTVVKPATSSVVSVCVDCSTSAPAVPETTEVPVVSSETPVAPVPASSSPVAPVEETPAVPVAPAPYPSSNGTTPIAAPAPSGTGAPTESTTGAAPFEGAASSLTATGAGILAIFGLVAFL